ncbi:hypothetical protein Tco_0505633 [Tanacetum coccineum]
MYVGWGVTEWYQSQIIMVNVIPPDHVDDVPIFEPNQHDDVPVVPEHVLVDEDEDPEEDEFKEEEDPQEEDDDMKVDIEEDENELELTYPIGMSVHEVGESSTAPFLCKDNDGLLHGLMRRDINSLFGLMASLSRRLCGCEMTYALVKKKGKAKDEYYEGLKLVEKLGNVEDKVECKKLKNEVEEARFSNTFLHMQNERVERFSKYDKVHHPSREDLLVIRSSLDSIVNQPSKEHAPMTQAAIPIEQKIQMLLIIAERASHAKVGNEA